MISRFKKGDKVRIMRNAHKIEANDEHDYTYFDKYVGEETILTEFNICNID